MGQFWAAVGRWLVAGFTSFDVLTILLSAAALIVAWRAFVRSKPTPPLQPNLRALVGHSGEDSSHPTLNMQDGSTIQMHYASVKVTILNAGPVPAEDVHLYVEATKYQPRQQWRLGQIKPDEHPDRIVKFASSDEPDGHTTPRIWVEWTEFPGAVQQHKDISLANDSRGLL